jgi:protein O-mannosyl-transferase
VKISRITLVGVALAIVAGTIWLYWPSVQGEFLTRMDDDEYLRQSVRLNGLTWSAVKWAFTTTAPYYHPLPRLSHVLDYQIWGKNAAGHHATSVFVHALNAALLFGFLWTLLGKAALTAGERFAMAVGVAVVFAIHPFQAESVAWMSGRTQLMCTTFGIGCLWAYVAGARRWMVWGLFLGALLCKPMAVSLPFVMLAIDYFPLQRHEKSGWGCLLREKAVLIGLGVLTAIATVITESRAGGLVSLDMISPTQRMLVMFQNLAFYPWRLACPVHFSPFYPLPSNLSVLQWSVLVSVTGVALVVGLVVWYRRDVPALAAGWGAYMALVFPVSGLTQTGMSAMSLRYAYLAMVPLLLLAGGAMVWAWRRSASMIRVGLASLLVCEACVFGLLTRRLIPVWHDNETLWRTVLAQFPDSVVANKAIVVVLLEEHRTDEALMYAQHYAELRPQLCESHNNLGFLLAQLGRLPDAIHEYEEALRLRPNYAEAHNNLGNTLMYKGNAAEAIQHYKVALTLAPDFVEAHLGMGVALATLRRPTEAIQHFEQVLKFDPDSVTASNMLARLRGSS